MTAQQNKVIITITDKLAADRWIADQAARETSELDAVSVYYVVKAKIEAGLVGEAKAIVKAWKAGQL